MRAKFLIAAAAGAMMLAGCDVTDPIYETAHPDQGSITLTADWSATNIATTPSSGCTVRVGECSETLTGVSQTLDYLFEPGDYTIYVHNTADGIAVNGTTATADYAGSLGWLYTGVQAVAVSKNTNHKFTVAMTQQVRELILVIEPTGGTIESLATITGTLSGVAGSLDFATGTHGTPSTVGLTFDKSDTAEFPGKWVATVRLLGVTGASQTLDITVTYNDGSLDVQMEDYDLGTMLTDFNDNKREPKILGGQIVETPTGVGLTTTITGWTPINGGNVIAD